MTDRFTKLPEPENLEWRCKIFQLGALIIGIITIKPDTRPFRAMFITDRKEKYGMGCTAGPVPRNPYPRLRIWLPGGKKAKGARATPLSIFFLSIRNKHSPERACIR